MEFRILGPLEVRVGGAPVRVGGPKQRALLAVLLCNANRVVSRGQLIDELLAEQPAGPAEPVLHVQISRLRKALADGDPQPRLPARPGTCVLGQDAALGPAASRGGAQPGAAARQPRRNGRARRACPRGGATCPALPHPVGCLGAWCWRRGRRRSRSRR